MINIAMLSKWHVHAEGYARYIQNQPDCKITCVWDEQPERGRAWAAELKAIFEPNLDRLLQRLDVDAVVIDTPTDMHTEVMIKAARAGKHIFTEKCMCLTVRDCDAVIEELEKNDIRFGISFPHRCKPQNLFIKQIVSEGTLGDITCARMRNCHDGALRGWLPEYWYDPKTTGGGAMMDLGAHPMYLLRWLLGAPKRIQSTFGNRTGHAVEDNAVCVIEFENGAIGISETSLVSPMTPAIFEVYGTKGVVMCVDDTVRVKTARSNELIEGGWFTPKLPKELPHPIRQWLDGILTGAPIAFGAREGRELTEMMENAYIAHETRKEQPFL